MSIPSFLNKPRILILPCKWTLSRWEPPSEVSTMTLSAAIAQATLHDHLIKKYNATPNLGSGADDTLPARNLLPSKPVTSAAGSLIPIQGRICIIGAGACGLYLALMLRYLGFSDFDILESSQRVGGRCYTQTFPLDSNCSPQ